MGLRLINTDDLPLKSDAADFTPQEIVDTVTSDNLAGSLSFAGFLKWANQSQGGRSTEYSSLDEHFKFPDTGLVVIAGRTKHGKTTLMKNIALRKALKGEKVYFYSLETPTAEMLYGFSQLLVPDDGVVNAYQNKESFLAEVRAGIMPEPLQKVSKHLGKNLHIIYNGRSLTSILTQLLLPEMRGATIFLDYLQKIQAGNGGLGSALEIQEVVNRLVDAAISNNLLIITGSQLTQFNNMSAAHDEVKGSRSPEEGASMVLRIWRQGISGAMNDMLFQVDDLPFTVDVKLNRDGPSGDRIGLQLGNMNKLIDPKE